MDQELKNLHEEIGIDAAILSDYKLPYCPQPPLDDLEVVDIDFDGRPFILSVKAAPSWRSMCAAALSDRVVLQPYSGFRSFVHQKKLIERHLANGRSLRDILTGTAIPGFSEHHSGRAVDIWTDGKSVLEEQFEKTNAYAWLSKNAGRFKFCLSYPRANLSGIIFEPWHWCFQSK